MGTIEHRLEVLERRFRRAQLSNRLLVLALVAVICGAGAQLSKPQTPKAELPGENQSEPKLRGGQERLRTLEADRFVLLDRLGRSRLTIAMNDDGPALCMLDENGRKRLELKQSANAAGMCLRDADEAVLASLQIQPEGDRAVLEIRRPQGSTWIEADGLAVRDRDQNARLQLSLVNGNFPLLGISQSGQQGPPSVEITAGENGTRALKIHDRAGQPLFSVTAAENGTTHWIMRHPDHERSLQASVGPADKEGPRLGLFAPARQGSAGEILARLQLGVQADYQAYLRIIDGEGKSLFTAPAK